MSIDDSRQQAIARLVALEAGLRINQVSHPTQNIKTEEDSVKLANGWRAMRKLVEEGKFSIKDNSHGNTLDFAESWIRWARENYPNREIAFFLDNFHKLADERSKDERIRFKHASGRIHALKNKLHFTAICTMELRKLMGATKSQRPSLQDISESKQMEYDNNLIGMVYSELHARRQDAKVFWTDSVDGEVVRKPVIEVDIQKNKITEFKGALYYKFNPEYSKFYECAGAEVAEWQREYTSAIKRTNDKLHPEAGRNPFMASSDIDAY
jgi:replicative DNA helicase